MDSYAYTSMGHMYYYSFNMPFDIHPIVQYIFIISKFEI